MIYDVRLAQGIQFFSFNVKENWFSQEKQLIL